FQAEDGIRDRNVTGVQTCALPISACILLLSVSRMGRRDTLRSRMQAGTTQLSTVRGAIVPSGGNYLTRFEFPLTTPRRLPHFGGDRKSVVSGKSGDWRRGSRGRRQ